MKKECPVCELMNADDADACRHCGTAFFHQPECLAPRLDNPDDNLAIMGRYANSVEANLVMTLLEGHGITACVPEELTPQIFWNFITSPLEVVTVRVARKDLEAAQRIIAERDNT